MLSSPLLPSHPLPLTTLTLPHHRVASDANILCLMVDPAAPPPWGQMSDKSDLAFWHLLSEVRWLPGGTAIASYNAWMARHPGIDLAQAKWPDQVRPCLAGWPGCDAAAQRAARSDVACGRMGCTAGRGTAWEIYN